VSARVVRRSACRSLAARPAGGWCDPTVSHAEGLRCWSPSLRAAQSGR
jgi:hypothetical protein